MDESIVDVASRWVVPEDAIAIARKQEWHRDVGVLLRKVDRLPAVIPDTGLMLAETIQGFVGAVDLHHGFGAVGVFAIDFFRHHALGPFGDQASALGVAIVEHAVFVIDLYGQAAPC